MNLERVSYERQVRRVELRADENSRPTVSTEDVRPAQGGAVTYSFAKEIA